MTEVFNNSLENEALGQDLRTGAIAWLHKGGERSEIKNWRPISLLCTDYEVLAKVLANMVRKILIKIINPNQTGGIPGRNMHQNLCIIRDVIANVSEPGREGIISLDFQKAYDRVDRDFLYAVMRRLNFPGKFIGWIRKIYTGAQARIILNGKLGEPIAMGRGIRQGCPLALYLFTLYVEPLHVCLQNSLIGTSIGGSRIRTFGYVDDVVILTSDEGDFARANSVIRAFEEATNARLNMSKTKILPLVDWERKTEWPYAWLNPVEKIKILGIDFTKRVKETIKINCAEKLQTISNLLRANWARNLTLHQRALFVNTHLTPIILTVAHVYPLEAEVTNKIQTLYNAFIWRNAHEQLAIGECHQQPKKGGIRPS